MSINVKEYRKARDLLLTALCDAMPASHSQRALKDKAAQLIGQRNMQRVWQRLVSPVQGSSLHGRINERARRQLLKVNL